MPQPELAGATDQISQEETTRRLNSKAQELRSDRTLTEVCVCCHYYTLTEVCVCCHYYRVTVVQNMAFLCTLPVENIHLDLHE